MFIMTIRTDKPEAEIGLFDNSKELGYETWEAHRQLAETIHSKIATLLQKSDKSWTDIEGLVCYKGPGSFTGLRIGAAMLNALEVPVVNSSGENWVEEGLLAASIATGGTATPNYGREPHITRPRK